MTAGLVVGEGRSAAARMGGVAMLTGTETPAVTAGFAGLDLMEALDLARGLGAGAAARATADRAGAMTVVCRLLAAAAALGEGRAGAAAAAAAGLAGLGAAVGFGRRATACRWDVWDGDRVRGRFCQCEQVRRVDRSTHAVTGLMAHRCKRDLYTSLASGCSMLRYACMPYSQQPRNGFTKYGFTSSISVLNPKGHAVAFRCQGQHE